MSLKLPIMLWGISPNPLCLNYAQEFKHLCLVYTYRKTTFHVIKTVKVHVAIVTRNSHYFAFVKLLNLLK